MHASFTVAVVIPFFQRENGILKKAISSVASQSYDGRCEVIVVDDGSPVPAAAEYEDLDLPETLTITLLNKQNGGAGSARNAGLDVVGDDCRYVAFLDSDDEWMPSHLEHAVSALEKGYDFYFSDHLSALYKDSSNFERIGTLDIREDLRVDDDLQLYRMSNSVIGHTVGDGGGVIGTSNVVYRFDKYKALRFREEFYNGQDFFFWMDLDALGAKPVFSTFVDCDCGRGINIYSNSGWGSDLSLQRMVNELQVWVSVPKFYDLTDDLKKRNKKTIRNIQENIVRDIVHRALRGRKVNVRFVARAIGLSPSLAYLSPVFLGRLFAQKVLRRNMT